MRVCVCVLTPLVVLLSNVTVAIVVSYSANVWKVPQKPFL